MPCDLNFDPAKKTPQWYRKSRLHQKQRKKFPVANKFGTLPIIYSQVAKGYFLKYICIQFR